MAVVITIWLKAAGGEVLFIAREIYFYGYGRDCGKCVREHSSTTFGLLAERSSGKRRPFRTAADYGVDYALLKAKRAGWRNHSDFDEVED